MTKQYDLITMGRSSIDLYSNNSGAPFEEISEFGAFVGGCPTNIAVGTQRLGFKSLLLTAVGDDPVGKFVLNFLNKESIETGFIPVKPGTRTSAVVLGIEPPDKFPLVFYRDNCADIELNIDDVQKLPFEDARALLISGTGLSKEPSRSATIFALEQARKHNLKTFLDIDFRADQWHDVRAFGVAIRSVLPMIDVAIGTQEEVNAAVLSDNAQLEISDSQISAPKVSGDVTHAIQELLARGPRMLVEKRGAEGAAVHLQDGTVVTAQPFKVDVCNVLGAGDAFASGFIYGYLNGWPLEKGVRMGNATGAIVVSRQGCANFMPTYKEAIDLIESQGGFKTEVMSGNVSPLEGSPAACLS